ncbi:MAG: acyltransferase [Tannerella sp.]|jgi:peptidoglycan/LPS O-acetylase OafA/YrhL|nr:acyltransferase [Tannerella sp.]
MTSKPVFSPGISKENSFDFLRLLFAFSVFISHFSVLTSIRICWPISSAMGVAGFFIISGFLITRSYYRSANLTDYAIKRIRRIVPACFLVVIACALLFSLTSSLPPKAYFTAGEFYKYVAANLSFLNFIQPTLPGVFRENPFPYVNGALWTIKVELALYACVPLLALFLKRKPVIALAALYGFSFLFDYAMSCLYERSGNEMYLILERQFLGQIRFFAAGIILLFYFDGITKRRLQWIAPFAALVFLLRYVVRHWVIELFFPISFAVLVISFAYYFPKPAMVSRYGDISYGFYLYHYPVIQLFLYSGWMKESPVLLFLACFGSVVLLSGLSWHLLEKRMLQRKREHPVNHR